MASTGSSLSQESLDIEDYDLVTRRSRSRPLRSRVMAAHKYESIETTDDPRDLEEEEDHGANNPGAADTPGRTMFGSGPTGGHLSLGAGPGPGGLVAVGGIGAGGEHESPTRAANRQKDKRGRLSHLHKGKTAKDKRKLREKRRSTGVVHIASTEVNSTGDSLDEVEGKDTETLTRKNTSYNEVIDADNPQTPEEERKAFSARNVSNKSPSDLDADLEDNQDYDSTVSQSETNLTMIGQSKQVSTPPLFHTEAPVEALKPSTNHRPLAPSSVNAGHPREHEHPSHRHHLHRSAETRTPGVHFHDTASLSNGDRGRSSSVDVGGVVKRTCTAHDGMEARLLAKTVELQKLLEKERDEKRHLQDLLDERDSKIAQLEAKLATLNTDLGEADDEYTKLQQENDALIRALSTISNLSDDS